jgi:hypothetical protein
MNVINDDVQYITHSILELRHLKGFAGWNEWRVQIKLKIDYFKIKNWYEKICGQWVRKKNNLGTKTNLSTKKKGYEQNKGTKNYLGTKKMGTNKKLGTNKFVYVKNLSTTYGYEKIWV